MTKLELKQENKRLRDTVHTQQVQINTMNKIFDKIFPAPPEKREMGGLRNFLNVPAIPIQDINFTKPNTEKK